MKRTTRLWLGFWICNVLIMAVIAAMGTVGIPDWFVLVGIALNAALGCVVVILFTLAIEAERAEASR